MSITNGDSGRENRQCYPANLNGISHVRVIVSRVALHLGVETGGRGLRDRDVGERLRSEVNLNLSKSVQLDIQDVRTVIARHEQTAGLGHDGVVSIPT